MTPTRARWADVTAAVERHCRHYIDKGGGENALKDLKAEESATIDIADWPGTPRPSSAAP